MSDAVSYRLQLGGSSASADVVGAVRRLEVEEHADLAGMIRLEFEVDLDGKDPVVELLEGGALDRLKPVRVDIQVGVDPFETILEAYVVESRLQVDVEGAPSILEVVAMDASIKMSLEERVKAWPDMADSDIASKLFKEHGLTAKVEASNPSRQAAEVTVMQYGSDMQFLRQLATRNGYVCYVSTDPKSGKGVGHFHPEDLDAKPQGVLTARLGDETNLTRFEVRRDHVRPSGVAMNGVTSADLKAQKGEVTKSTQSALGKTAIAFGTPARTLLLPRSGLYGAAELKRYAQSVADRSSWAITAEGELDPALYGDVLRARKTVLVRGVGTADSGAYMVERVLHTFAPEGYLQSFALRRNATGPKGSDDFRAGGGR